MSVERLLTGVFEDVQPALRAIACVDDAAIVDEDVADPAAALTLGRLRQESGDLFRAEGIPDVINAKPCAEPRRHDGVLELGTAGLGLVLVDDVRADAASDAMQLLEIFRCRHARDNERIFLFANIDHPVALRPVEALIASS